LSSGAGIGALAFGSSRVRAQAPRLTIISHKVHQDVTKGPAQNVLDDFLRNGANLNWLTFGTPEVQDRVFREASLRTSEVNVGYVLPHWVNSEIATNLLPLDALDREKPLNRAGIFPGMLEAGRVGGQMVAVPVRGLVHTVHYNRRILEQSGAKVPTTIEEYAETAIKCTKEKNGVRIYGHAANTSVQEIFNSFMSFARAFGEADFVTTDGKVLANSEPNLRALELYREIAMAKAMPPEWTTYSSTDVLRECRQGRAALTIGAPATYYLLLNDKAASQEAGNWETIPVPPSRDMKPKWQIARHNVDFWSMVVPKNGPNPALSWDWIRFMTSDDVQLKMALNGNGPVSRQVFKSEEWRAKAPFADQALAALEVARPIWPPFGRVSEAIDIFGEEVHATLLGRKRPKDALDDATRRITRVV
jgi:multiple sugar transport system substrate-binding protein